MRLLKIAAVLMFLVGLAGCSEETQQQTKEALQQTGEAVEGAARDAAEGTREAAESVERSLDGDDVEN